MAKSTKSKKQNTGPEYVNDPSLQALSDILLWRNRNKNFIDRAANPGDKPSVQTNKLPGLQNQGIPDYVNSTHLMADDFDKFSGKGRVYPMLVQKSPGAPLEYLKPNDAYDYADQTGEYVETPSHNLAEYFSKQGYKMASDNLYGTNYKQYMMHEYGGDIPKNEKLMKVRPKYFDYDSLPCPGCKKNLMAATGMAMSPGPKIPGLANTIAQGGYPERELFPSYPQLMYDPSAPISTTQLPPIDTNKAIPQPKQTPQKTSVAPHQKGQKFNAGTAALLGAQALSAILADNPKKQQVVQPQMSYNPYSYGLGSQALMNYGGKIPMADYGYVMGEDENNTPSAKSGIYIKPSKRGSLHDALGIPRDQKIPASKLKDKPGDSPAMKKKKNFARNAKKWKHDDGGIVPFLFQGAEDLFGNLGDAADMLMNPASALGGAGGGIPGMEYGGNLDDFTAKDGKWIQKAVNPAHKGYCTPMTKSTCTPRRKALAKTFKKMARNRKKDEGGFIQPGWDQYNEGGIIPDNMSNFSPHKYEKGGNINGGANIQEVGATYPNTDLMEQWLLYADGGNVNGGANIREVSGNYPNSDLMEQWLLYKNGGGVNGSADVREVGATYPNSDLLEQWLLYPNGGQVKPKPKSNPPIYTSDPNDPHLQRYKDSSLLYNTTTNFNNKFKNAKSNSEASTILKSYLDSPQTKSANEARLRLEDYNKNPYQGEMPDDLLHPSQPIIYRPIQPSAIQGVIDMTNRGTIDANIEAQNIQMPRTDYSATFPEGSEQKTAYFHDHDLWNRFVNNNSNLLIDSQEKGGGKRGSATLKNRPMEYGGGVNGEAKVREVDAKYPNTDLMEQWLLYNNGGQLSASKAKEMLRDGTAHGKKLTKKQKQYFGMVAAGKAAAGTTLFTGPESGDPKPKTKTPTPGEIPTDASINLQARRYQTGKIDQDALVADRISELIGNSYDPYDKVGRTILTNLPGANDQFVQDLGVRLKLIQSDPTYNKMTPEQRINRFYSTGVGGTSGLDQFIKRARTIGGSPAAYWQNNPSNPNRVIPSSTLKNGGVMYDDGGQVETMWGGDANLESYNPYDGGTIEFKGPSHENGGIGMHYNGNPVEVEGGEYASKDSDGDLHIYGNMYIPGSKTKFKQAAKAIAGKEKRYDYLKTKGSDLVNNNNPANRYEQLAFNSGRVMMQGGEMGQKDLASKKERLASLQKSMLDMAQEHGIDPFEMSKGKMKKAKKGASIPFYQDGGDPGNDPTRADRNMNPGNIKYGDFAKKYGAKKDKDGFAIFPNRQVGEKAMKDLLTSKGYKNLSAREAINKWTAGHPYRYDLGPITDKKISEMDPDELSIVMGTMTKGEGTRYGVTPRPVPRTPQNTPTPRVPTSTPYRPYELPDIPLRTDTPNPKPLNPVPEYDFLNPPKEKTLPSNVEPLGLNNMLGEIYGLATNRVEPVPAQRYEPQLFTPYQVSFQDRLNANQSVFNAQMKAIDPSNPAALGVLGAQKYAADQQVYGDEFRTNQAIAQDITNKNISLVNDANLKNLGIADTQMVRQSQARSKTREFNQMILNSLSDKYAKNEFENKRLAAYENLYDYRFVPTDDGGQKATYFGPNAYFNYQGKADQKPQDVRRISRYDAQGNLKGYADYDESDLKEMQRVLDIQKKKQSMGLVPKLNPLD